MRAGTFLKWGALVLAGLGVGATGAYLRAQWAIRGVLIPPTCFEVEGPEHHRFRPGCRETLRSYAEPIEYRINEDGLRERPRSEIRKGQVLVLGDSVVEGMGLREERTFGRLLEARGSGTQFINGGIRFAGSVLESLRGERLVRSYEPAHLLWFLAENDVGDDLVLDALASRRDPQGLPIEFSGAALWGSHPWLWRIFGSLDPGSFPGAVLRNVISARALDSLALSRERQEPCRAVQRLRRVLEERGIGLTFVLYPFASDFPDRGWKARAVQPGDLDRLAACAASAPVIDLRPVLAGRDADYQDDRMHLLPHAMETAAQAIAQRLELKEKAGP